MKSGVVILAGGEGSRIGGDKPLRLLGGSRFIDRAIAYAQRLSPVVAVSMRHPGQIPDCEVETILDDRALAGPLAGLQAALAFANRRGLDAVLTMPCDAPFLPDDMLRRLEAALDPETGVAVARSGDHIHPSCALWRTETRFRLRDYIVSGRRSLHGFADFVGRSEAGWPTEPLDPFFNVNSADDLRRAEQLIAIAQPRG